jgi:hypothetical protein
VCKASSSSKLNVVPDPSFQRGLTHAAPKWFLHAKEPDMSDKQKQPLPKDQPDKSKAMEQKMHQSDKFRRGIDEEEEHRQGGNRVSDAGSHKR